jgi:hypothetical protein
MNPRAGAKEFRNIPGVSPTVVTSCFARNRALVGSPPTVAGKTIGPPVRRDSQPKSFGIIQKQRLRTKDMRPNDCLIPV